MKKEKEMKNIRYILNTRTISASNTNNEILVDNEPFKRPKFLLMSNISCCFQKIIKNKFEGFFYF